MYSNRTKAQKEVSSEVYIHYLYRICVYWDVSLRYKGICAGFVLVLLFSPPFWGKKYQRWTPYEKTE